MLGGFLASAMICQAVPVLTTQLPDLEIIGISDVFHQLGSATVWRGLPSGGEVGEVPVDLYRAAVVEIRTERRREVQSRSGNPTYASELRGKNVSLATSVGVESMEGQDNEVWCFKSGTWVDTAILAPMRFDTCQALTNNPKYGVVKAYRSKSYGNTPTQQVRLWATAIYENEGSPLGEAYCSEAIRRILDATCVTHGHTLGGAVSRLENFAGEETGKIIAAPVML